MIARTGSRETSTRIASGVPSTRRPSRGLDRRWRSCVRGTPRSSVLACFTLSRASASAAHLFFRRVERQSWRGQPANDRGVGQMACQSGLCTPILSGSLLYMSDGRPTLRQKRTREEERMRPLSLVPYPMSVTPLDGVFELTDQVTVGTQTGAQGPARLLRAMLSPATGFDLAPGGADAQIQLSITSTQGTLGNEGYRLRIEPSGLHLEAGAVAGLRNGLQTLRQLLPTESFCSAPVRGMRWEMPCLEIEDAPRFSWRGALLDVARHFLPFPSLIRIVDLLAMHKINVLHLHLTDDQGWRFPSEKYPRLTEIGSWRRQTVVGHARDTRRAGDGRYDGTPHGGFYTAEQLRDLVSYATERNITVMPEIDFPGHSQAAIAAYPGLGNLRKPLDVRCDWGISQHVLNLEDSTLQFCREILSEVMTVFPSEFIHVGGDECPRTEWASSPAAMRRIHTGDALDIGGLQSWFTAQLNAYLRENRRNLVGWDEILEGGELPSGATVMSWRGEQGGVAAATEGFDVVMAPEFPCYFYHYQSTDSDEPLAAYEVVTLQDVYAYEPVPAELRRRGGESRVLGSQFCLWREYMPTSGDIEYMAFPRACAFSEALWSRDRVSFAEFNGRLADHLKRLEIAGVNFRPLAAPSPWQMGGHGPRQRVKIDRTPGEGQQWPAATGNQRADQGVTA